MTIHYEYKNLVFEGGGMAGLAYIGCLKVLEENKVIDNIENFAGTSSGAIMASLVSIGYTSNEIYNITKEINWSNMVLKRHWIYQFFHFWNYYGLFKYDNIENTLKQFFLQKLGKNDLTFEEHYQITKKNLILVGVNVSKKQQEYFCKNTTPDMSVIKAIKISTSFPFIFDPIKHNDMLYIDGGVMNNFPIEYFNNSEETLGLNLTEDNENLHQHQNINNILNFGMNILYSILLVQEHCDLKYDRNNVIYIKTNKANILQNIVLMNQNLDVLYETGVKYTRKYFQEMEMKNNNERVKEELDCDS